MPIDASVQGKTIESIDKLIAGVTAMVGEPYLNLPKSRARLELAERLLEWLAIEEGKKINDYEQYSLILTGWNYLNLHQNPQYH